MVETGFLLLRHLHLGRGALHLGGGPRHHVQGGDRPGLLGQFLEVQIADKFCNLNTAAG